MSERNRPANAAEEAVCWHLLNSLPGVAVQGYRTDGTIFFWNPASEETYGYSAEEALGRNLGDLIIPSELRSAFEQGLQAGAQAVVSGELAPGGEYLLLHKNGKRVRVNSFHAVVCREGEDPVLFCIDVDLSQRWRMEAELRESRDLLKMTLASLAEAIFVVDASRRVVLDCNPAAEKMFGYSRDELIGRDVARLHGSKEASKRFGAEAQRAFEGYGYFETRSWMVRKNGESFPTEHFVRPIAFPAAGSSRVVCVIRDITERTAVEEKLRFLSLHDPLTGLPNRNCFEEVVKRVETAGDSRPGIMVLDVDGLKLINDTLGHEAGDILLRAAGEVICSCFRDGDHIARIGGDEFIVLLQQADESLLERTLDQVREALAEYNRSHPQLPLSLSCGYAVSQEAGGSLQELRKKADNNMYREKLLHNSNARGVLLQTLRRTLEERDFFESGHAQRLGVLVEALAARIGLEKARTAKMRLLVQFHDLGKVGIESALLLKQEPLTPGEKEEMQRHCEIGHRIALASGDLAPIAEWILKHHEWWNGGGYPFGLRGEEIPLECRLLAVAEAYEVMTGGRPYRQAVSPLDALAEIRRCSGEQFDPWVVETFVGLFDETGALRRREEKGEPR